MYDKVGIAVIRRLAEIHKHELISEVIIYKPRRRVNVQRRSADDQHIGSAYIADGAADNIVVKRLLIQNYVRPYDAAAGTARHARALIYHTGVILSAAARAVRTQYAAVKLQHVFASRRLMQPVYILRDDGLELTLALKLREAEMRAVRLHAVHHELLPVEAIVLRRVALKKAVAEYSLGRVLPLLVVKPVHTAEIGYPAFRAHARATEKDDVITFGDHFFKFCDIPVHFHAPSAEVMFRRPLSRAR